jgi:hypothetical protein
MFVSASVPQYPEWKLAGEEIVILIFLLQIIHEFAFLNSTKSKTRIELICPTKSLQTLQSAIELGCHSCTS